MFFLIYLLIGCVITTLLIKWIDSQTSSEIRYAVYFMSIIAWPCWIIGAIKGVIEVFLEDDI